MKKPNEDDFKDHSRWQAFVKDFVEGYNPPVLEQMRKDIKEIEQGMRDVVRPIINHK